MSLRVRALLDRLEAVEWFAQVGRPPGEGHTVDVLPDWPAALAALGEGGWWAVTDRAAARLGDTLEQLRFVTPDAWNRSARRHRPVIENLVGRKTAGLELPAGGLQQVVRASRTGLTLACVESEFSDRMPVNIDGFDPEFFRRVAAWYERGHFPCGWAGGAPPAGTLVVF